MKIWAFLQIKRIILKLTKYIEIALKENNIL